MTYNEIIQALQCCFIARDHTNCPLKAYGSTVTDCRGKLAAETLKLLSRQTFQIELLTKRNIILSEKGEKVCLELIKAERLLAAYGERKENDNG